MFFKGHEEFVNARENIIYRRKITLTFIETTISNRTMFRKLTSKQIFFQRQNKRKFYLITNVIFGKKNYQSLVCPLSLNISISFNGAPDKFKTV